MGLFDVFRKKPADAPAAAPGGLLGALIQRYGLQRKAPPPESALSGTWWEQPPGGGLPLAFLARGGEVAAFLGEPAEITEIYLVRGGSGAFGLAAGNAGDFAELRLPAVQAGLARLSASVMEFHVYENRAGVSLQFAATAAPLTVERDLEAARAILQAVGK